MMISFRSCARWLPRQSFIATRSLPSGDLGPVDLPLTHDLMAVEHGYRYFAVGDFLTGSHIKDLNHGRQATFLEALRRYIHSRCCSNAS